MKLLKGTTFSLKRTFLRLFYLVSSVEGKDLSKSWTQSTQTIEA